MKNVIKQNRVKKELSYQGDVILKYDIQYPEIVESDCKAGKQTFNQYNKNIADQQIRYAQGELYKEAKEVYEYNKKNGYPVMIFELVLQTNITYNQDQYVSLYQDRYVFQGGAHGNTIRTSQNWDLQMCKQIPLHCFYPGNPYFILDILKQIIKQIKPQEEYYFEDYCCLVIQTFNPESYYMVQDGLMIYFEQYDIAPYSTGIPEFLIKQ